MPLDYDKIKAHEDPSVNRNGRLRAVYTGHHLEHAVDTCVRFIIDSTSAV
jgi:hypothetical protein